MNKFLSILLSILLIFTGFNYSVFADENEIDETNEPDTNEVSDYNESIENENKKHLESINKEINLLKDDINNLKNLPSSPNGRITNYNLLSYDTIDFIYNNWNEFSVIIIYNSNNPDLIIFIKNEDIISVDTSVSGKILVNYSKNYYYSQSNKTLNLRNESGSVSYFENVSSDDSTYGFIKVLNYYELKPYKLNIKNNGIGVVSINPNSPYINPQNSLNGLFYTNCLITLTYDDNGDFTGWYDRNGNLLSNDTTYTFNINNDELIIANYYTNPVEFDYSDLLKFIILILTLIFFTNIEKGVLNGN